MTVAEIQGVVAMYLQRSVAKFDVSGTSANLLLVAMNNARKYAERKHNWSVCRKKGYLSVTTANEVAWDSPTWFGGGTEKMREGKHWWLRGDTTDTTNKFSTTDAPIKILGHGVKHVVETKQDYEDWGEEFNEQRQLRQDSNWHPMLNQPHGLVRGKWLELYPRPTSTQILVVDGYAWWPAWTDPGSGTVSVTFQTSDINLADEDGAYLSIAFGGNTYVFEDDRASDGLQHVSGGYFITTVTSLNGAMATITPMLEALGCTVTTSGLNTTISAVVSSGELSVELFNNSGVSQWSELDTPTLNDYTDWWTENAEEYLILRTLVECNRLGHVFVGNKEGNLPSPEKQAEQLLQDLILQDSAGEMAGGQIELY
jgi:hypothetical protein